MRIAAHVATAYVVLLLFGVLWRVLPFDVLAPNVPILLAAYLGITTRDRVPHATLGAVLIGYLADLLMGSPRGLMAFVCGALCVCGRLMTARLMVRGRAVVMVFAFLASLLASLLMAGVRLYLGGGVSGFWREVLVALGSAGLTALVAPLIFKVCRRVDVACARTAREREAAREGWLP
jgi:rod shape-determining protein MreD